MTTLINPDDPTVIAKVIEAIRTTESGGRYGTTGPNSGKGSASGAYGITDSTWRAWCKSVPGACQYQRAYQAPPNVQDAVAGAQAQRILKANGNVLESVPATWYVGFYQPGGKYWNTVPSPQFGNKLTVSEYINTRWIPNFQKAGGNATNASTTAFPVPPGPGDFLPGGSFSIGDAFKALLQPFQLIYSGLQWMSDPNNWYRVFEVVAGFLLFLIALWSMIKDTSTGREIKSTATKVATVEAAA